ncbi:hypothetical protein COV19_06720 [Candidatus Woesearchaeota archaeon CG10_big_fil_rev_8_21_14_0_10_44_13]|nr:MAG: hypothetical protein COV19_06720 [Candidatus Woesearchaeota archaeon CG10_big_fil_rev_8_21_14_0_10_44_13]
MAEESQEDYDLMPHQEVTRLRREVEDIKQHPFGSTHEGKELLEAISGLSQSMDHLTGLFQEAAEQMKLEERESELIGKKLDPLFGRIDELIDQNGKIAKGIIAVADMVKETNVKARPQPAPAPRPYPQQQFSPGIRVEPPAQQMMQQNFPPMANQGNPSQMSSPSGMPPPPPPLNAPEKKGFFSLGKK